MRTTGVVLQFGLLAEPELNITKAREKIWNMAMQPGDVIAIQAGCRHTIIAETELTVIEVQLGKEISVHDKKKYPLED